MNVSIGYTEGMQSFLSAWQRDNAEAFNIIRSTIQNIEESFQSVSTTSSEDHVNIIAEIREIHSASTSYGSVDTSLRSHFAHLPQRSDSSTAHSRPHKSKTVGNKSIAERSIEDDINQSVLPYLQRYNIASDIDPRFRAVYRGILSLGEIQRSSEELELMSVPSNPKEHSPMLRRKASEKAEKIDLKSSKDSWFGANETETGHKVSFSSNREKANSFELFEMELEGGLFSNEFVERVCIIESQSETLSGLYEKVIEHIFCTKNEDESYFKSFPRGEIIYSIQVDGRKFFELLSKAITELKTEKFFEKKELTDENKKEINDHMNFLQMKLEKFIRQVGCTADNYNSYKGKLKTDEIELKRLYERARSIYDSSKLKERAKRCLRDFYAFCQRHVVLFPTYHAGVNDKAPKNSAITIEYVTVRKLLEKLTECQKTIFADLLMETVIFTYDHFISPHNLLLFLIKKYYTPRPLMMCFSEYSKFKDEQSITTKLRILDIIKFWVDERKGDFERDPELLTLLITFIESIYKMVMESTSKSEFTSTWEKINSIITSLLYKNRVEPVMAKKSEDQIPMTPRLKTPLNSARESSPMQARGSWSPVSTPKVKAKSFKSKFHSGNDLNKRLSMTNDELLILIWEPREIAKQLALVDHELFRQIDLFEMVKKRWKTDEIAHQCPNSIAFIRRFNSVSFWVQYLILYQGSEDERWHLIQKFLEVAAFCLEFQNYNSAHSIYCALVRLHDNGIWSGILSNDPNFIVLKEVFSRENLTQDMDKVYRSLELPAIPSIPYFTTAFFKLQDQITLFTKFDGQEKYLKNFMLEKLSDSCKLMRKFQKVNFQLIRNEMMHKYLKDGYKANKEIDFESTNAEELLRNKVAEVKKNLEVAAFL